MVDFALSKHEQELYETAMEFTHKYITPHARELEEANEFPLEIAQKAKEAGLMYLHLPKDIGGQGYTLLEETLIAEAIGYGDAGIATTLLANNLAFTPILLGATQEQLEKYMKPLVTDPKVKMGAFCLTERQAGSDAAAITTTAEKDGDEWIINGRKCFSTNGHVAAILSVFTTTDPSGGYKTMTCHMVPSDTPGVKIGIIENKMGQGASFQCSIEFTDVRVPADCLLGKIGDGFKIAMQTLDKTRAAIAAIGVGVAQRAVHEAAKFANHRRQFGQKISKFQGISFMLADMEARTMAARWATRYAAWLADQGIRNSKESSLAKVLATEAAMQNTTDCVQIMGGYGYLREYPAEQMMRGAKLLTIYEGTNEIQRVVASGLILKEAKEIDTGFRLKYDGKDAPDPWS
ncbi:MAG: acyl-CoA dehydrogenase family protein [Promethearchaeota archaeon]